MSTRAGISPRGSSRSCSATRSARGFGHCANEAVFERAQMPAFAGATGWLNSEPPGPAELATRGLRDCHTPHIEETHMSVITTEPAEVTAIRPFTIETP